MTKKIISIILLTSFTTQLLWIVDLQASEGPAQPEATQFEPVETTDLVNLSTGDFVYTLPLMEVPGPEGGYPIVLSYHSGIGPNQEPTWVGLGWSLNPGAISRLLSGYPDDYSGQFVQTAYHGYASGWGIGLGIGYGPVGMNVSYDSNSGFGVNGMLSIAQDIGHGFSAAANVNTSGQVSLGLDYVRGLGKGYAFHGGASIGAQGASLTSQISKGHFVIGGSYDRQGLSGSANYSMASFSVGFSLSSQGAGAGFSVLGAGVQTISGPGSGTMTSFSIPIPIPLPGLWWASASISEWKWRLDETYDEMSYGYIYQQDYPYATGGAKYERILQGKLLYSAQDVYITNAQGLNGSFKPFVEQPYSLQDGETNSTKGILFPTFTAEENSHTYNYTTDNDVTFRFLGDEGANYCTDDGVSGQSRWGTLYDNLSSRFASKQIDTLRNAESGLIDGFIITDIDGTVYEFAQPVRNIAQFSWAWDNQGNEEIIATTALVSPFAGNWLLTMIKGPDYVERAGEEDWGYWVKFNYTVNDDFAVWRAPYQGRLPNGNGLDVESASAGIRESVYLETIETASHVASFSKSSMQNRFSPDIPDDLLFKGKGEQVNGPTFRFEFEGNWKDYFDALTESKPLVYMHLKRALTGATWDAQAMSSQVFNSVYLAAEKKTRFELNDPNLNELFIDGYDFAVASLYVNDLLNDSYSVSSKLEDVKLYNKLDPHVSKQGNNWVMEPGAIPIKTAGFDYDYSLCPNAAGSVAPNGGKLTLKSVRFVGQNGATYMPPYSFEYAYGDVGGSGYNPAWHKDDWDNWGSYRDPADRDDHLTPQISTRADRAAAWSLTKITTPTGGDIEIEYESDQYMAVGTKVVNLEHFDAVGATYHDISQNGADAHSFVSSDSYFQGGYEPGDFVCIKKSSTCYAPNGSPPTFVIDYLYYREVIGFSVAGNTVTVELGGDPVDFSNEDPEYCNMLNFSATLLPRWFYGGGSRVKSLTTKENGSQIQKTRYIYNSTMGRSYGVTASLPARYKDHRQQPDGYTKISPWSDYTQSYLDHELSYGRPAPGVLYSQVEVMEVVGISQPVSGKTVYEFFTAKDYAYDASNDRTGIFGKPKTTTYFEQYENNGTKFRPVKKDTFVYAFSDELYAQNRILAKDNIDLTDANKPLGLIQEKYHFKNQISATEKKEALVERICQNVYLTENQSKEFYYDTPTSTTPTSTTLISNKNVIRDALSGQILASASYDSEGEALINRTTPAYWKYDGMEDKNMLTQDAQTTTYDTDLDINADLMAYAYPDADIAGSTVKTWSNQFSVEGEQHDMWRVNDTYIFDRDYSYSTFNDWQSVGDTELSYTNGVWRMTSNVTQYDKYSHPIEESHRDGTYTASIYGFDAALPIAIATNARLSEIDYIDFEENGTSNDARTGELAAAYNGSTINSGTVSAPAANPPAGIYVVTAWIKPGGASSWTCFETTLTPGQQLSLSGAGLVDDIRIYPKNATMQTFSYDPITSKVTAITDANNITAFYEYDEFGRLIRVRDQDRNMISRHHYDYAFGE